MAKTLLRVESRRLTMQADTNASANWNCGIGAVLSSGDKDARRRTFSSGMGARKCTARTYSYGRSLTEMSRGESVISSTCEITSPS